MLNSLALQGARVVAGRADNLHVSGHAYQVRQATLQQPKATSSATGHTQRQEC
jgi:mRNA degradation ribonuclease J1/J2